MICRLMISIIIGMVEALFKEDLDSLDMNHVMLLQDDIVTTVLFHFKPSLQFS